MKLKSVMLALGLVVVVVGLQAQEKGKPVTLKGSLVCGKCTLRITPKCSNVLQVKKDDGKTTNYFLVDKGKREKYHKGICPPNSRKAATVTGTVTTKNKKNYIKPTKVEVK